MVKPSLSLNPDAQPWGRWVEKTDEGQDARIDNVESVIAGLLRGDGGQATQIAAVLSRLATLEADLKYLYSATSTAPPSAPTPPPAATAPTNYETTAEWSRTWGGSSYYTGSGEYTNATYLYQGQSPENKVGMWRFNVGPAAGRTIVAASMFIKNINSAWSSSFVAQFGTHGNASAPVGKPGRQNGFDVGWNRGEGKWVAIPSWAWGGLSNGSIQGFTVGAAGPSDANSAWFMGVGQPSPPVLRLSYR